MLSAEQIARVTHEANRAYCASIGDLSQKPWDEAEPWQRESALRGVTAALDGTAKTPEEQHQAWYDDKARDGWVYGEVKDAAAKTHPCMVAYHDLPIEQQRKDALFRAVVAALTDQAHVSA
jgi:hypothetical protein